MSGQIWIEAGVSMNPLRKLGHRQHALARLANEYFFVGTLDYLCSWILTSETSVTRQKGSNNNDRGQQLSLFCPLDFNQSLSYSHFDLSAHFGQL